jgi:hypothetical protein
VLGWGSQSTFKVACRPEPESARARAAVRRAFADELREEIRDELEAERLADRDEAWRALEAQLTETPANQTNGGEP